MASKRREQGPSRREKIIERQAFESMEIALIEHQAEPVEEPTAPVEEPAAPVEEASAAPVEVSAPVVETAKASALANVESSSKEAAPALGETKAETSPALDEPALSEPSAAKSPHVSASKEAEVIAQPGLPKKTAHDPTSHNPEGLEETGDGATFFWIFLAVLLLVGMVALFRNG